MAVSGSQWLGEHVRSNQSIRQSNRFLARSWHLFSVQIIYTPSISRRRRCVFPIEYRTFQDTMCVLLLALLSQTQPSPEFRSAGNSAEVWRHRLRGRLKIIADPVSDFKNRSWARQSSGALTIRPKSGDIGYAPVFSRSFSGYHRLPKQLRQRRGE